MNSRPAMQMWLPLKVEGELFCADTADDSPSEDEQLMERVVKRGNLIQALKRVKRNSVCPYGRLFCCPWSAKAVRQRIISTEPPWYVIRMPGGVGGGEAVRSLPIPIMPKRTN